LQQGNHYFKGVLGEVAEVVAKTNTFLGQRQQPPDQTVRKAQSPDRLARSILVIIWQLLSNLASRSTTRPRPDQAQPRPPARSPRFQGHPQARRL